MYKRIDKEGLFSVLNGWNSILKKRIHLIACGGTALTLLNIKESTKDIDFIVPKIQEYKYIINLLKDLGYKLVTGAGWSRGDQFIFDLYEGNRVFTTNLLESPLERGNNILVKEFSHIYLGALNYNDLAITKLFRCNRLDIEDCVSLFKAKKDEIDIKKFRERFLETILYNIAEERMRKNLEYFLTHIKKLGVIKNG